MAIQPMALGVNNPEINALGSFAAGQQHAQQQKMGQIEIARANLQDIAQMANDTGGDPAKWEQGLDIMEGAGFPVQAYRGRADLAPMVSRAALTAAEEVQFAQNEDQLNLSMQRLQHELQQAAQGPAPTAEMRNFDWAVGDPEKQAYIGLGAQAGARPLTPEERATWGIPAEDNRPYAIEPGKAPSLVGGSGGQTINVNTGGDNALDKALSEAEGKAWSTYKEAASVSSSNSQDFEILGELLTQAPQGPVTGRLADTFKGFSAAGDAANSIIKRIAPTLRAPGSGATSDIEYNGMLQSLPSLAQLPEANAMVLSIMQAKAQINMERGRIISEYQSGAMEVDEARAKMDELNSRSIMTPEMKKALVGIGSDGEVGTPPPAIGEVVEGYTYNGGDPSSPSSWTKVN